MVSQFVTILVILVSQIGLGANVSDAIGSALSGFTPEPEYIVAEPDLSASSDLAQDVISSLSPLPVKVSSGPEPVLEAKSAIALDAETKQTLFADNSNQEMAMASITKVMAALLVIEEGNLDDVVTVEAGDVIEMGSDMDLREGEQITLRDLVRAALIKSANDAAYTMARHVGGGDVQVFIDMMNAKAKELGLYHTHYANPHGFDADGHYSTARDIAILMAHAMENKIFRETVRMKEYDAHILNYDRVAHITATNKLLIKDDQLIEGGKTGFTDEAGECLVLVAKDSAGHRVVTVILHSPRRFAESQELIDYAFGEYSW